EYATPGEAYSGIRGRKVFLLDVPEDTLLLKVEVVSSAARDIDLFVGYDENGSGHPVESAERCRSTTPGVEESCMIEYPQAGKWWVLVQNWRSSAAGASADVELGLAALTAGDDSSLTVIGAGYQSGGGRGPQLG